MPNQISFTPTSYEQLSGFIGQLNTKTSEIKVVESSFKFDDSIDGVKGKKTSNIESALYASLVFGENKTAVKDGIYYYKRCILNNKNGDSFASGLDVLCETAKSTFGVTNSEIDEIIVRAQYDHLLENNEYAKKLLHDGREDLVATVARAYVTNSKNDKNTVLNKTKEIVSQVPIPTQTLRDFIRLTTLLVDLELSTAIEKVVKKAANNDPSFKEVTIASAN